MAIFGRDYYGKSKYGNVRTAMAMAVDPFRSSVVDYDTVRLTWSNPTAGGFCLVRSRNGYPTAEDDGVQLLRYSPGYTGVYNTSFLDDDLAGGWHYYAIFLYDSAASLWERAAIVDAFVPFDFKSTDKVWDSVPDYYRQVVDTGAGWDKTLFKINPQIYLNQQQMAPNLELGKFLGVFGWGFDILRSQAEQTLDGYDVDAVHVNRLALLAEQFGSELDDATPANVNRSKVRNLGWLYRKRGTIEGIREMLALSTGWEIEVIPGRNIMLSEDQTNFVNPQPQYWSPSVQYVPGDFVLYGTNVYACILAASGSAQAPPLSWESNTWWDAARFQGGELYQLSDLNNSEPILRSDTGDVGTWQVEGPNGFSSGSTHIGAASTDPEDGSVTTANALGMRNFGTATADFVIRSVPRHKDDLTSWNRRIVIKDGIPVPRTNNVWKPKVRYRAGDLVMFQDALYEARITADDVAPTNSLYWKMIGHDERPRLCLSWYAHGPLHVNAASGQGGRRQNPVITEFDGNGNMIADHIITPASYDDQFYDPFTHESESPFVIGRKGAKGEWTGGSGVAWETLYRDGVSGMAVPTGPNAAWRLSDAVGSDLNVAITFRRIPTTGRLLGLVFRWVDSSNFWFLSQTGLHKVVAGATQDPTGGAFNFTAQNWDRFRVEPTGNVIKVYRNGTLLGSRTDSTHNSGTRNGIYVEAA